MKKSNDSPVSSPAPTPAETNGNPPPKPALTKLKGKRKEQTTTPSPWLKRLLARRQKSADVQPHKVERRFILWCLALAHMAAFARYVLKEITELLEVLTTYLHF